MRELLKYYKLDIPLTECYEYTARPARLIGYGAQYQIRDTLMAYAGGYDQFGMGSLQTAGGVYTQSIWGGGLLLPEPYRYPSPAVAAVFTLTNILDQAVFEKTVSTGSNSIYLQEYSRKRGDYVYTAWAPAGDNTVEFIFPDDAEIEFSDMYGERQKEPDRKFTKTVNGFPFYLISSKKITGCSVVKRTFPPVPPDTKVVAPLAGTDEVLPVERPFYPKTDFAYINGKFDISAVSDSEKGKCLEVKLDKRGEISPLQMEYFKLKLLNRPVIHGNMDWIGLWVKGDSGWGKISFEMVDAAGRKLVSDGIWHDFDCQMTINHDGWRYIRILFGKMDYDTLNPSLGSRWSGWDSKKQPNYPVTVTGINIALRRVAPDPVNWVEVPGCIRIRDLAVSGAEKVEYQKIERPDAKLLQRLNASGLRELITAGDIRQTKHTLIENNEIKYTVSGNILRGCDRFIKKETCAFEIRFRIPADSKTALLFSANRKTCFTLSPTSKNPQFVIPADQNIIARFEVKDKKVTCLVNGKKIADADLESTLNSVTLFKTPGIMYVSYIAICDNDGTAAAEAEVSEVGATNTQEQDELVGK